MSRAGDRSDDLRLGASSVARTRCSTPPERRFPRAEATARAALAPFRLTDHGSEAIAGLKARYTIRCFEERDELRVILVLMGSAAVVAGLAAACAIAGLA